MAARFHHAALFMVSLALLCLAAAFTGPVIARADTPLEISARPGYLRDDADRALSPSPGLTPCRKDPAASDREEALSQAPAPEERSGPPAGVIAFFVCFALLAAAAILLTRLR
jgi:hypothetical protein